MYMLQVEVKEFRGSNKKLLKLADEYGAENKRLKVRIYLKESQPATKAESLATKTKQHTSKLETLQKEFQEKSASQGSRYMAETDKLRSELASKDSHLKKISTQTESLQKAEQDENFDKMQKLGKEARKEAKNANADREYSESQLAPEKAVREAVAKKIEEIRSLKAKHASELEMVSKEAKDTELRAKATQDIIVELEEDVAASRQELERI
ncbi:hypothetical protein B0J14DRAFT_646543 [Halenospora varia]|nr:hypothetical protein B0J14DRAFT_646543 [Halenospora varia]